ncbi:hypothetical protein HMPREF0620_1352 [Parascardovia denticolens DSM 10105 = JCM 12538]|uniref:Uncharacterized protein n=1 Tax=Parascardovia denticolens DSM 10105 = JCM 12538 TaxID=864564 RepID=E6K2W3_PARDN|nr:hypothetical protein HMPREF0620_1352 [Parascardovia denticolens DSM 10105 = JCM 12538]
MSGLPGSRSRSQVFGFGFPACSDEGCLVDGRKPVTAPALSL